MYLVRDINKRAAVSDVLVKTQHIDGCRRIFTNYLVFHFWFNHRHGYIFFVLCCGQLQYDVLLLLNNTWARHRERTKEE